MVLGKILSGTCSNKKILLTLGHNNLCVILKDIVSSLSLARESYIPLIFYFYFSIFVLVRLKDCKYSFVGPSCSHDLFCGQSCHVLCWEQGQYYIRTDVYDYFWRSFGIVEQCYLAWKKKKKESMWFQVKQFYLPSGFYNHTYISFKSTKRHPKGVIKEPFHPGSSPSVSVWRCVPKFFLILSVLRHGEIDSPSKLNIFLLCCISISWSCAEFPFPEEVPRIIGATFLAMQQINDVTLWLVEATTQVSVGNLMCGVYVRLQSRTSSHAAGKRF